MQRILYVENPKDSTQTVRTNKFSEVSGYQTNTKSVAFLYTESEQPKQKIRRKIPLISKRVKMFRNKLNE